MDLQIADQFEERRDHLRAVAYRMLGSASEADDVVQEAWLRFARSDVTGIENLQAWLTTVVSRLCLDTLRARSARREDMRGDQDTADNAARAPGAAGPTGPEEEAVLADSVGLALLVVLDRLSPAERVAYVLHDLFAVPFAEIAPVVGRTPTTTKKLASRARRRVHGASPTQAADVARHRPVVEAFLSAARGGDVGALLTLLAPDVVQRADRIAVPRGAPTERRGAKSVGRAIRTNQARARFSEVALVDGQVGLVVAPAGQLQLALRLTIRDDRIVEIDVIGDPARLQALELQVLPPH